MKKNIKKLGVLGSIASIISVGLFFISSNSIGQISYGNSSPNISNTTGNININYNTSNHQSTSDKYGYLKHPRFGSVDIKQKTELMNNKTLCVAEPYSKSLKIDEKQTDSNGYFIWVKVKVISGRCNGKVGWVGLNSFNLNN